jgi:putative phosphoribosyl transferase
MPIAERVVTIPVDGVNLSGDLTQPSDAIGLVIFAHGSGSSRRNPRNRMVAARLHSDRLATLLFDLLTVDEEVMDRATAHLRFDIRFLANRLIAATKWADTEPSVNALPFGYFGASTGAAAALVAAAEWPDAIGAIVSRAGRPDLAGPALPLVYAPTLLIVGGNDVSVIELNERARAEMRTAVVMELVPHASDLLEEPGTLEEVARLSAGWFTRFLAQPRAA